MLSRARLLLILSVVSSTASFVIQSHSKDPAAYDTVFDMPLLEVSDDVIRSERTVKVEGGDRELFANTTDWFDLPPLATGNKEKEHNRVKRARADYILCDAFEHQAMPPGNENCIICVSALKH